MAVSNDLERHCKAAVRAQAIYGAVRAESAG
jgi:hypothetical protein